MYRLTVHVTQAVKTNNKTYNTFSYKRVNKEDEQHIFKMIEKDKQGKVANFYWSNM